MLGPRSWEPASYLLGQPGIGWRGVLALDELHEALALLWKGRKYCGAPSGLYSGGGENAHLRNTGWTGFPTGNGRPKITQQDGALRSTCRVCLAGTQMGVYSAEPSTDTAQRMNMLASFRCSVPVRGTRDEHTTPHYLSRHPT